MLLPLLKRPPSLSPTRWPVCGDQAACARMATGAAAASDFGTLCRVSPEAMGGATSSKKYLFDVMTEIFLQILSFRHLYAEAVSVYYSVTIPLVFRDHRADRKLTRGLNE